MRLIFIMHCILNSISWQRKMSKSDKDDWAPHNSTKYIYTYMFVSVYNSILNEQLKKKNGKREQKTRFLSNISSIYVYS